MTGAQGTPEAAVLVVEDDLQVRQLVRMILEGEGYEVLEAADGLEGLHVLRQHPSPLVVLLDWMLPGIDGVEVLREMAMMRRVATLQPIPPREYIFMSAALSSRTIPTLGIPSSLSIRFIAKPFDIDELLSEVDRAHERLRDALVPIPRSIFGGADAHDPSASPNTGPLG